MVRRTIVVGALAALLAAVAVMPATAKDGDVRVRGTCTAGSTAKLKLSEENGRIEVEYEVDQNRNGVAWRVTLRRNGAVFFRGARTTRAPSGSFTVRRLTALRAGTATIVARATRSGEVCTARASF
jgi:2-methylaconitate cis-trans-isomerase PrpF